MAICDICKKEMTDPQVTTCAGRVSVEYPDGTSLSALAYNPRQQHMPNWFRCPDCNVAPGGIHHHNCDQEICPRCGEQLISCDCFNNL